MMYEKLIKINEQLTALGFDHETYPNDLTEEKFSGEVLARILILLKEKLRIQIAIYEQENTNVIHLATYRHR